MRFQRDEYVAKLQNECFDLLVIGGGITGAGIARDAAMRGLSVAVVESRDFASGTSSRSSKLLHGGIRYLEKFELGLVYESSQERRLHSEFLAPHLSKANPFMIPVYPWSPHGMLAMGIGVHLYDALALFRNHGTRVLSRESALSEEPLLESKGLRGGVVYHDVVMDDARIALENIHSATLHGATAVNYMLVRGFDKDSSGKIRGVWARDILKKSLPDFLVRAKVVVNATGPWSDYIRRLDDPSTRPMLRPTKGVHLILPSNLLGKKHAFVLTAKQDNRVFFSIPWFGRTLIGTTDTDYSLQKDGDLNEISANQNEIDYLMEGVKRTFPSATVSSKDIISTFAGVRPLVSAGGANPSEVSRDHRIWREGSGMYTIAGGKYTTYRSMAKELVDKVLATLKKEHSGIGKNWKSCFTHLQPIVLPESSKERQNFISAMEDYQLVLGNETVVHLQARYGGRWQLVADMAMHSEVLRKKIIPSEPDIYAEITYSKKNEMAISYEDFLRRRTLLALRAKLQNFPSEVQDAEDFFYLDCPKEAAISLKKVQGIL